MIIKNNTTNDYGGGACFFSSSVEFHNSLILNNESATGGISLYDQSSLVMVSSNVLGNISTQDDEGGGIHLYDDSDVNIVSTIIRNNLPFEININDDNNSISVDYSNVLGGESGIHINENFQNQEIVWGTNNIDSNPLFCNPDSGDYTLAENSPCVGTGENGANMGALDVGCGPYNFSPTEFSLSTPSNNAQITIDDSNMSDGFITFSWGESSDENGDSLVYLMHATSTDLEDFSLDTNITSIDMLNYMEIVDEMSENNITSATIEWTVDVTDGIDTVTANNAPFTLIVDGSDALSALAEKLIPEVFALRQNYPNPFNPTTQIRYDLPEDALVAINIYDIMGRSIRSLVNSKQTAGYRSIQWNATNNLGEPVSAGMYIYMIQAGEFRQTKKMVLLK